MTSGGTGGPPPPARGEHVVLYNKTLQARTTPAYAGRTSTRARRTPRRTTPPARGERTRPSGRYRPLRTTPACAGRTRTYPHARTPQTDHPRLRGENSGGKSLVPEKDGPPPPARGELDRGSDTDSTRRTTPACAGRTPMDMDYLVTLSDHPRLRGENFASNRHTSQLDGPPPPARGEHRQFALHRRPCRTTPACAGRTGLADLAHGQSSDHPRLRGENYAVGHRPSARRGPPPPARGERGGSSLPPCLSRTTPACAGRTKPFRPFFMGFADHPRLRGENAAATWAFLKTVGPPPPARGEPDVFIAVVLARRTTPACAGRTDTSSNGRVRATDHPRLRGENVAQCDSSGERYGPPPPARGERRHGAP